MKLSNSIKRFLFYITLIVTIISCSPNKENLGAAVDDITSAGQWQRVGPGGGGGQFIPSINPHDSTNIFIKCDMTGSYVTYNGGESWQNFNLHAYSRFFEHDPVNENAVYASGLGLMKSNDKGATWSLIYPTPDETFGFVPTGDHAAERIVTKDSVHLKIMALGIDPANTKNLYISVVAGDSTFLHISKDQGATWTRDIELTNDVVSIYVDPTSDMDQRSVYLQGRMGIIKWVNGDTTFNKNPEGVYSFSSFATGYDQDNEEVVTYGISGHTYYKRYFKDKRESASGIYVTKDGGSTWTSIQEDLVAEHTAEQAPEWRALATSAFNPGVVYVSYNDYIPEGGNEWIGVAKSIDYGQTWDFVWKDEVGDEDKISENFNGGWLNERWGPSWGENPFSIAVYAHNPDLVVTTDFGRTIKSTDGGKSWEQIYTRKTDYGWASRGIDVTTSYQVAFDPFNEQHVYLAQADIGLIESYDGGKSWKSGTDNNGVPGKWTNTCYQVEFDPKSEGKAWILMSWIHDLPRAKMWRKKKLEDFKGGILRTTDGGKSWEVVSKQIGEAAYTNIMIDSESEPGKRTLYACGFGKGVYKSTDDGLNWSLKNNGIDGDTPFAWRLRRRESDGALFLIVHRRSEDGSIDNPYDGAVYVSKDGAESWEKLNQPENTNGPTCVAFDADEPNKIILSTWGREMKGDFIPDAGGGIFISEDAGASWRNVLSKDQHIGEILYDERVNRYYAIGFNGSAYYSVSNGEDWQRIDGYNFKWGQALSLDPRNSEMLFILTFGGGAWHGPATGDQNANQDVISPKIQW